MDDIRNEVVGDEEVRGISGGQRKRVNVGLELVADPIMLFLDEPTSGLDSTSSKMVISALQEVGQALLSVLHFGPAERARIVVHAPNFFVLTLLWPQPQELIQRCILV